jgi:UDP-glucose 4-epimerase
VDNLSTGKIENVHKDARFYELDIVDEQLKSVFNEERPQIVCHYAAQVNVRHSIEDPLKDADANIMGSINLLENCVRFNVQRFIYISSAGAVYGEPIYLPVDEEHPIEPLSPYGASKHAVEHYLALYQKIWGLDYVVLRYPNVYGPRQDPAGEAGVVAVFTERMLAGKVPQIFGDGEQTRDFAYVDDMVDANILVLQKGSCSIYNLGTGRQVSVNQVYQMLCKIIGTQIEAEYTEERKGEVRHICIDAKKAANELGWRPRYSFEEGLKKTVEYYRRKDENMHNMP